MKFLLLTTFVATICDVSTGGKTQRLLAAMNAGMLAGMNGGMLAGVNGGLINGVNPAMLAGGLTLPMVAGGGAGFIGQPQFAQFVPRVPVYAVPAPIPNMYPVAGANVPPFMGAPQMAPGNPPPPQQPLMGNGGAMPQQLPLQTDPMRRFRRQIMKSENTLKAAMDTQIPPPTESITPAASPCAKDGLHEDH